jgi:glycerol kinase
MSENNQSKLIGVVDAGTNSVQFVIYRIPNFEQICYHEIKIKQISLKDGWLEHDPIEIINAVRESAKIVINILPNYGFSKRNISAIGITNQRETTVTWNKKTGLPLYNAIGEIKNFLDLFQFFLAFLSENDLFIFLILLN